MNQESKIFVAGHRGLVGSAIVRYLEAQGYRNVLVRSREQVDLMDRGAVDRFLDAERPEYVFLAAAKVGGILANDRYPADFLYQNLAIEINVIDSSWRHGVKKLAFLGSSCIYPRMAPQPIREEYLLTGALEPTNQWYAIAKIAGLLMGQAYYRQHGFPVISLMPTNLYGPGDNFDLQSSHVLPALLRKFDEAKRRGDQQVTVWGTGTPRREFLHVDDLAAACVFLMNNYSGEEPVNVGTGTDVSIAELVDMIRQEVGYTGQVVYDTSKPDGTPRKWLDVSRLTELGWQAQIGLAEGIHQTYRWFEAHRSQWPAAEGSK